MVVIQRKRPARATLVGWQGRRIVGPELGELSLMWLQELSAESRSVREMATATDGIAKLAGEIEQFALNAGTCDAQLCREIDAKSLAKSRAELERAGYLGKASHG